MTFSMEQWERIVEPFDQQFEPATREEVIELERRLGVELPSLLATLLMRFGRCSFAGTGMVRDPEQEFDIFVMF